MMAVNTHVQNNLVKNTRIKKPKTINNSIAKSKFKKQHIDYDWRNKFEFYSQKEMPLGALETLADLIINTVKTQPEVMTFNKILALCDVQACSMEKFLKRSEKLRKAKSYAMFMIGINREEAALHREIDCGIMKHMQGRYDALWKEQDIFFAELRKNNQPEHTTKIVVLEKFESTTPESIKESALANSLKVVTED